MRVVMVEQMANQIQKLEELVGARENTIEVLEDQLINTQQQLLRNPALIPHPTLRFCQIRTFLPHRSPTIRYSHADNFFITMGKWLVCMVSWSIFSQITGIEAIKIRWVASHYFQEFRQA